MHIPDHYLSPVTCAVMTASMVPVWTYSVKKIKLELPKEKIPLLGIGAAFSFLFMMFNVPLPGGTTGHAVGGTLLAVLLGPYAACICITVSLLLQALLFGDGGILAFGANCFNMAFVLPFVGYAIYSLVKKYSKSKKGETIGLVIASYLAINISALCAAIEFGIQPILFKDVAGMPLYCPYPMSISIPSMVVPHLLVAGVVEALFTQAVIVYIRKVSPGTIYQEQKEKRSGIYILLAALICLTPLGLLAQGTAWGEWGMDEISKVVTGGTELGFIPKGMEKGFSMQTLFPDYTFQGLPEVAGYILSAIAGVAIIILLFKIVSAFRKEQ